MKYILITGAGNGLGYQTTKFLVEKGYFVFACDLNINTYKDNVLPNVKAIELDVTKSDSIIKAYNTVKKISPKIDGIINYAGISFFGSLIETPVEKMEKVLDVNLFGTIRINKVFYYLLREKKGRIINIGSENGWQTVSPFNGIYAMSKYALNAYNQALRRELRFFNIKVILIEPGSFKSNMHNNVRFQLKEFKDNTKLYYRIISKMGRRMEKELNSSNDIKYLFKAIETALESKKPKIKYRVKNSRSLTFLSRIPESASDDLFYKNLK